jgi:hypothetical protein
MPTWASVGGRQVRVRRHAHRRSRSRGRDLAERPCPHQCFVGIWYFWPGRHSAAKGAHHVAPCSRATALQEDAPRFPWRWGRVGNAHIVAVGPFRIDGGSGRAWWKVSPAGAP